MTPGLDHADLVATVRLSRLSAEQQLELLAELSASDKPLAMRHVLDAINARASQAHPPSGATSDNNVAVTAAAVDKFSAAARDAILLAGLSGKLPERIYDRHRDAYVDWKPERRNYGLATPINLAQQCLILAGMPAQKVLNLSRIQVAKLVMGTHPGDIGLSGFFAGADGPAYNVSGMFANILLDAQNVSLRRSYDDTRTTFQAWMGRGPDIADFKNVNRIVHGETADPAAIPEDGEFEETTFSDGKETYKLTVWGRMLSFSWQSIVNDQLGAFVQVESRFGATMARKLNRLAYQELKDNAALSDSVALFHASAVPTGHNNITTGTLTTSADYTGAWNTMTAKMSQQKGLDTGNSSTLNLMPEWIVYPPALRGIIRQTLGSPSVAINSAGNEGTTNIWQNGLQPVEEAELGAAATGGSDTAFYLAAATSAVDTIEYAFLQGLPAPVVERADAFDRLAMRTRIYFAFGVKALDYRGLQRHDGA